MSKINKIDFIEKGKIILSNIFDDIDNLPSMNFKDIINNNAAALVVIDMSNGFTKSGPLKHYRIKSLIPNIVKIFNEISKYNVPRLVINDCHHVDCSEFDYYPVHCVSGTDECEVIDELKEISGYTLINKNSTNGVLEKYFQKWLHQNLNIDTFIVVGNCTDICIMDFCVTLKSLFNKDNKKINIIIPIDCVDTFDNPNHNGDFMHMISLYFMRNNGINIIKQFKY